MTRTKLIILTGCWMAGFVQAEVAPVKVYTKTSSAWVGQHLPFYIDLRARGSFSGSASFEIPKIPGTLVMRMGSPVVGTQEIEGES